jgi:hypothetical protein
VRNAVGSLCGYVGTPQNHPFYGKHYADDDALGNLDAHGGITFAHGCDEGGLICHIAQPGEPEAVWWLGFDAAHASDYLPGIMAKLNSRELLPELQPVTYKDLIYMRSEVEQLADQVRDAGRVGELFKRPERP